MDILTNLPFKVEFLSYSDPDKVRIRYKQELTRFTTDSNPTFIEDYDFYEFDNLVVKFYLSAAYDPARLYMDCFDYIDDLDSNLSIEDIDSGYIELNREYHDTSSL